jgi:hypothetical protein
MAVEIGWREGPKKGCDRPGSLMVGALEDQDVDQRYPPFVALCEEFVFGAFYIDFEDID